MRYRLGARADRELQENALDVGFHRFRRDLKHPGNLLVGHALADPAEDIALALRQHVADPGFGRDRRVSSLPAGQQASDQGQNIPIRRTGGLGAGIGSLQQQARLLPAL